MVAERVGGGSSQAQNHDRPLVKRDRGDPALPAAPAFNERLDTPKLLASLSPLADKLNYDLV
jgi:hypothetical protein